MIEDDENTYIDKSQWIPLKTVKEYAERAVNAGRKIYNNGSIIADKRHKSAIDRLVEDEGVLKPEHQSAAEALKTLTDCAEGRLVSASHNPLNELPWITPSLYLRAIYYQISRRQKYYIDRIVFGIIRDSDIPWMRQCQYTLLDAFDSLCRAMKKDNALYAVQKIRDIELDKEKYMRKIINSYRAKSAPKISLTVQIKT